MSSPLFISFFIVWNKCTSWCIVENNFEVVIDILPFLRPHGMLYFYPSSLFYQNSKSGPTINNTTLLCKSIFLLSQSLSTVRQRMPTDRTAWNFMSAHWHLAKYVRTYTYDATPNSGAADELLFIQPAAQWNIIGFMCRAWPIYRMQCRWWTTRTVTVGINCEKRLRISADLSVYYVSYTFWIRIIVKIMYKDW